MPERARVEHLRQAARGREGRRHVARRQEASRGSPRSRRERRAVLCLALREPTLPPCSLCTLESGAASSASAPTARSRSLRRAARPREASFRVAEPEAERNHALHAVASRASRSSSQRQSDAARANGADRGTPPAARVEERGGGLGGRRDVGRRLRALAERLEIAPALPSGPPSAAGTSLETGAQIAAARRGQRRCGSASPASIGSRHAALTASKLGPSGLIACRCELCLQVRRLDVGLGCRSAAETSYGFCVDVARANRPGDRPAQRGRARPASIFAWRHLANTKSRCFFISPPSASHSLCPTALSTRWRPNHGEGLSPEFSLSSIYAPIFPPSVADDAAAAANSAWRSLSAEGRRLLVLRALRGAPPRAVPLLLGALSPVTPRREHERRRVRSTSSIRGDAVARAAAHKRRAGARRTCCGRGCRSRCAGCRPPSSASSRRRPPARASRR